MYKSILIVRFINIKSVCFYIYVAVVLYKYIWQNRLRFMAAAGVICLIALCFISLLFANPGTEKEANK